MRVSIFSESPADEAAIRVLVDGILQQPTDLVPAFHLRSRGWPSVLQVLPAVVKHLHYTTNSEGLVLVVDSNTSPMHSSSHVTGGAGSGKCRLCQLLTVARETQTVLRPRVGSPPLKLAIGLAVPSVEAWYRHGLDPHINEASWAVAMQSRQFPYDVSRLKSAVYGTSRPPLSLETRRAVEETRRIVDEGLIPGLLAAFPSGFAALHSALKGW